MGSKVDNFPRRHWLLFMLCAPGDIIGWFLLLVLWGLSGDIIFWKNGLWVALSEKSWLGKSLFKKHSGGCLCHGGWYRTESININQPKAIDSKIKYHEHLHVEQYEVVNVYTIFMLLFINISTMSCSGPWLYLAYFVLCVIAWWVLVLCSWFVAWLRGEDHYKGNVLEESAYTQDDDYTSHLS